MVLLSFTYVGIRGMYLRNDGVIYVIGLSGEAIAVYDEDE